jgi:hypothetical protein
MKKLLFTILIIPSLGAFAQDLNMDQIKKMSKDYKRHYGIKAGYNYAKVTGSTPDFHPKSNNGFFVSGFMAPASRGGFGFRSEIIYSKQGFSFDASGKMNNIMQEYIYLPQLTTFTIAKKLQLQAGGQMGYLVNAKQGSPDNSSSQNSSTQVMDYFNRIDYGAAAGIEVYPVKQVIIGARYNVSLGNIYKRQTTAPTGFPSPFPFNPNDFKGKNAVVQLFLGVKL